MIVIHLKIPELLHMLSLVHRCALKRVCRHSYILEKYFIKAKRAFSMSTLPHLNTQGWGRILKNYANPLAHLGFA